MYLPDGTAAVSASGTYFKMALDAIAAVYDVTDATGNIRRLNVNLAPLEVEEFRLLKEAGIGTYQLFQETYHRPTYAAVHLSGRKRDYDWRASALDRAMQAGARPRHSTRPAVLLACCCTRCKHALAVSSCGASARSSA